MSLPEGRFPADFAWGAATASYQIEGAVTEDGRGPSIWDTFCAQPGKVYNGESGAVACDHYHRYAEDIQTMQELHLSAYRFSVSWSRVLPTGRGQVNEVGLSFYERLVDGLLAAGITPYCTLYHWDLPQTLQDAGGWANRDTAQAFAEYAYLLSRRLGDRIQHWMTLNEPSIATYLGHLLGDFAPGIQDERVALQVAHHLLLSHGLATRVLRTNARTPATQVGIALALNPIEPASGSPEDAAAAERADAFWNRWFLDPMYKASYPEILVARYGEKMPQMQAEDLQTINAVPDFLGVNYYFRWVVKAVPGKAPLDAEQVIPPGAQLTEMGWEVYPHGLYQLLTRLQRDYEPQALYVTENGAAFADVVSADGQVHDPQRLQYLQDHFSAAHQAIREGVPLKGYFVWSLLDNFEWASGYSKRFGLIYVDYPTQRRIVKDSGKWYSKLASSGVLPPT